MAWVRIWVLPGVKVFSLHKIPHFSFSLIKIVWMTWKRSFRPYVRLQSLLEMKVRRITFLKLCSDVRVVSKSWDFSTVHEKTKEKTTCWPRSRWEGNIKTYVKGKDIVWIELAQDIEQCRCLQNMIMNLQISEEVRYLMLDERLAASQPERPASDYADCSSCVGETVGRSDLATYRFLHLLFW